MGKGMTPRKGYSVAKYVANYDDVFKRNAIAQLFNQDEPMAKKKCKTRKKR